MDEAAQSRLNAALANARPEHLRTFETRPFAAALGKLYTELEYIHPFTDDYMRTLREFTKQLAKEAGYALEWDRYKQSEAGKDLLLIARDISVNP